MPTVCQTPTQALGTKDNKIRSPWGSSHASNRDMLVNTQKFSLTGVYEKVRKVQEYSSGGEDLVDRGRLHGGGDI